MKPFRLFAAALATVLAFFGACGAGPHITGVAASGTDSADHRQYAWKKGIVYLNPDRTPFLQVLSRMKTVPVTDVEFKTFERDYPSRWVRVAEAMTNVETDCTVDDGTAFRVDDICIVGRTGELIHVTAVAGNDLTIVRGYAGSTAAAFNDDDWIRILFSKEDENGVKPTIVSSGTTTQTNFAQIFKRSYGISNTRKAMTFRSDPHSLNEMRMLAQALLKEDMEGAYLWGKKNEVFASGVYTWFTGGLNEFCETNRVDLDGGFGFGDVPYLMNVFTRFGSSRKVWLSGRDFRQQMDGLGIEYRRITGEARKLGFAVDGFRTSFGDAMLVTHLGLDNAFAGHCFVFDPAHVRIAQLRAIKEDKNIQTPGTDGEEHQFIGQNGLWGDTELAHGVIYNATAVLV